MVDKKEAQCYNLVDKGTVFFEFQKIRMWRCVRWAVVILDTKVNAITAWYTFAPVGANVNNPDVCVIYQWELSITSVE